MKYSFSFDFSDGDVSTNSSEMWVGAFSKENDGKVYHVDFQVLISLILVLKNLAAVSEIANNLNLISIFFSWHIL